MNTLRFIDAHHHLWDLQACHYPWLMARGQQRFFGDPTPIQKNYLVEDFLGESSQFTPSLSVHIQVGVAESDALRETEWLQQQADFPHAAVGFVDLARADAAQQIEAQQQFSKLRGIRQIIGRHAEEDRKHGSAALLENPAWLAGLQQLQQRGLSFDLQMIPPQMPALLEVLRQVPELDIALCHCGSPWDQSEAGLASWRKGLEQLARLPRVMCKVSGLGMFNRSWTTAQLQPIIEQVIEVFGCERVMFGSNFPVDKLYCSYDKLWKAYTDITAQYSADEREQLFYGNAARFYRLDPSQ